MPVRYRPVFLPNQETPNTFRAVPFREDPDGSLRAGKVLLAHKKSIDDTAKRNEALLRAAFKDYIHACEGGFQGRLIAPVNSFALANAEGGARIVGAFKKLDPGLRKNVIIEVFQFPRELSVDLLDQITIPLIAFFDLYIAEPNPELDDFTLFSGLNYLGVSLNLSQPGVEDDTEKRVTKFWAEATKRKLKVFISGVEDQSVIDQARRYEAFGIDGPALGEDRDAIAG